MTTGWTLRNLELRYKTIQKKANKPPPKLTDGLRKSEKIAGQLQPALTDKFGNIVDGLHRLTADPSWRTQRLDWVTTEKDRLVVKIHANYRRTVAKTELATEFVKLAKIILSENKITDPKDAASAISKLVPYTERYVRELLPEQYKHTEFSRTAWKEERVPPRPSMSGITLDSGRIASSSNPKGVILAGGMLLEESFTVSGETCMVNWELRKIWIPSKT